MDGADPAVRDALRDVAAASDHVVVVVAAQDLIAVTVTVEVWDQPAAAAPTVDWTGPLTFNIECPTGRLVLGDATLTHVDGIDPAQGPGRYHVEVFHTGRDRGEDARREALAALGTDSITDLTDIRHRRNGQEQYLIRLRHLGPTSPDRGDHEHAARRRPGGLLAGAAGTRPHSPNKARPPDA